MLLAEWFASIPARVGQRTPRPSPRAPACWAFVPEVAPSEQLGYTNAMMPGAGDHVTAVRISTKLAAGSVRLDALQDETPDGRLTAPRRDSSDASTF